MSKRLVSLTDKIEVSFNPSNEAMDNTQLDYAIDLLPEHEATSEGKQILKSIKKFGNTSPNITKNEVTTTTLIRKSII